MRKKDLIDAVVERSGHKRRDVKAVIENTLAVLGEALAEDREMNLPPFAKLKVQRVKQQQSARVIVAKLRQQTKSGKDAAE
ncbi:DNA-binding protein [Aliishimia ponticola]|uniref:DNA-binding protein n=2 Tax=Aliishimia ponticola TaxID=2499833 RepID=A0A4S4NJW8_9RHOB|nr:DNA-binding protein [Aliishimia ponticola]